VLLDGGRIGVTQQDLQMQSVRARTLDAVLLVSGQAQGYQKRAHAHVNSAERSADALHWACTRQAAAHVRLEAPLAIDRAV
jgi:hypothetical protein